MRNVYSAEFVRHGSSRINLKSYFLNNYVIKISQGYPVFVNNRHAFVTAAPGKGYGARVQYINAAAVLLKYRTMRVTAHEDIPFGKANEFRIGFVITVTVGHECLSPVNHEGIVRGIYRKFQNG